MEDKKNVGLKLYTYQEEAVDNTGKIWDSGKRVAGISLFTGGGKTYISMAAINKKGQESSDKKNSDPILQQIIDNLEIIYFAPTVEILTQTQRAIAKELLKLPVNLMDMPSIEKAVKKAFSNLTFECYQSIEILDEDIILKSLTPEEREQKLREISQKKEELRNRTADLVIIDEAHRTGAPEFQKGLAYLFGCEIKDGIPVPAKKVAEHKNNMKILAISATPERDVDGKNMMDLWAKALDNLTNNQIESNEHMATQISLPQAIRQNKAKEPDTQSSDAELAKARQYEYLFSLYKDPQSLSSKNFKILEGKLNRIDKEVLGIPGYHLMSEEEQDKARLEKQIELIKKAIQEGKISNTDKFMVAVPRRKPGSNISLKEHYDIHEEEIRMLFEKNGIECGTVYRLNGEHTDLENSNALLEFNKPNTTGKVQIIMGCDKILEGLHIEGISGTFVKRRFSEVKNTKLRAQSIAFLQLIGRNIYAVPENPEERTNMKTPVIFDMENNFFIQNIDNPCADADGIAMFQLTEKQKILLDEYYSMRSLLPEKTIGDKLQKLVEINKVLRQYGFFITNTSVQLSDTLDMVLNREPLLAHKDEIIGALKKRYLYNEDKPVLLGKILYEAKEKLWKNVKSFEKFTLNDMIDCGVIDITTIKGRKELEQYINKAFIDQNGFIVGGVPKTYRGLNIYTGTEYGLNGLDIDGFYQGQFDSETGFDKDGYNRQGFNADGKYRNKKYLIHDKYGFMMDGTNIVTGLKYDKLGYDINGIKPITGNMTLEDGTEKKNVILGGWDRTGRWHIMLEDGTYSRESYEYTEGLQEAKDIHGFRKKDKLETICSDPRSTAYMFNKKGEYCGKGGSVIGGIHYNNDGFDINGFDQRGFNAEGIHKYTSSEIDESKKKRSYYLTATYNGGNISKTEANVADAVRKKLSDPKFKQALKIGEDGKFHYKQKDGSERESKYGKGFFDSNGTNVITAGVFDIYGFTILDHNVTSPSPNRYGFVPSDIPTFIGNEIITKHNRKYYRPYQGKTVNILGTDEDGTTADDKQHPAIQRALSYINDCVIGKTSRDDFIAKTAIKEHRTVPEIKMDLNSMLQQAMLLYRICPGLQSKEEVKNMMKELSKCSEDTIKKGLLKYYPGLNDYLFIDCQMCEKAIRELDLKIQQQIRDKQKKTDVIQQLRSQQETLRRKLEELRNIPGISRDKRVK